MKRLLIILLLSFVAHYTFGQLYIEPSIGYSFSSNPLENQSELVINNKQTVYETKLKYGEGVHLGLNLGYSLMNTFFVELNAKKSIFSNYTVSTIEPDLQSLKNCFAYGYFGKINNESSIIQIAPLVGFQIQKNKFSTYVKLGPNFLKSTIIKNLEYTDWELKNWKYNPLYTVKEYQYSGNFHMGLQANLGIGYSIKQNLQLVLDYATVYNNYEITEAEIKYYEIDGVSQLNNIEDTNIEINELNKNMNHSYFGINIGIRYTFNKKE